MMRVRTLLTILTLTLCITANATNYYFSSSKGDDSRSFTQAQDPSTPWKSIGRLNSWFPNLKPGDQILFKTGDTFYGSIKTAMSGSNSSPIVLSSYGNGPQPIITGFTTVSDWNYIGSGIYESNALPTGATVNMVTINGQEYAMGRYPNASSSNGGYLAFESHGYRRIIDNENPFTSDWNGAQLVVRTARYLIERTTIKNISGNTISYSPSFHNYLKDNFGYFVQNSIKTLDQFGEWYYNPNTKKISVYFGNNAPSSYKVKVSSVDILLNANHSYIVLNSISLTGANKYGVYNDLAGVNNLQIKNSNITFSGINGIALAGTSDFLLQNTTIVNSNSNGIDLFYANPNAVIKSSTIQNTATFKGMIQMDAGDRVGMGIYSSEGITATNNNILNTGFIPIYFNGNDNLIQNNYIDTFCTVLDDGAGIYTFGGNSNPTFYNRKVISNIVLHGIGATAGAFTHTPNYIPAEGIYYDDNSTNIETTGNTIAYCSRDGIYVHNARGITLRKNVLFDNYIQLSFQHDGNGYGVSGGVFMSNQAFSKSASELVMMLQSPDNDFTTFGSFDSNYYCRPFNENGITYTNWFDNKDGYYNLPGWQSTYNKDWHAKKTPVAVTDTSDVLFQYNTTTSTKTITLNGTYVGLDGTSYSRNVKLAPYSSIILLKTSSVTSKTTASAAIVTNTSVNGPGYINSESVALTVKAYPNPSSSYFTVTTRGGSTSEPMTLRVIDQAGRLIQAKTGITTNSTLQIGQDLTAGTYILELIQGNKKVEQKLIKLSK